jgi:N-acetyl-anhydromuramyl-L-alanine amidase AmpD
MRNIDLIVIHCSATRSDRRFSVEDLIACHNARFGFTGYHYYITREGQVIQTRHENLPGAHARHYNQHSIGICYEGGLTPEGHPADTRTPAQKHALVALLRSLKTDYPDALILGHRDLPNVHKDCPCFDAKEEYQDIGPLEGID